MVAPRNVVGDAGLGLEIYFVFFRFYRLRFTFQPQGMMARSDRYRDVLFAVGPPTFLSLSKTVNFPGNTAHPLVLKKYSVA
jgi:hypothetical protein